MFARACFVTLVAIATGCAAPDETCKTNDTRACLCSGGMPGAQSCVNGTWGACSCGVNPDQPDANTSHPDQPDARPSPTHEHGDLCKAPDFDCGDDGLVCVVDHQGDTQGMCRRSCTTFSDCLHDDSARSKFDTDCCDIANGTSACDNKSNLPSGAVCT